MVVHVPLSVLVVFSAEHFSFCIFNTTSTGRNLSVFLCVASSPISSSVSLSGRTPFRLTCSGRWLSTLLLVVGSNGAKLSFKFSMVVSLYRPPSSRFVFLAVLQTPCNENIRRSVHRTGRKSMCYILTPFSMSLSISATHTLCVALNTNRN